MEEEEIERLVAFFRKEERWKIESTFPINNSLVRAAKHLLCEVYERTDDEELMKFDYLPESYKSYKLSSKCLERTSYSYHYRSPTHIFFRNVSISREGNIERKVNVFWNCDLNFINEIEFGEDVRNKNNNIINTDCSGFICGLFLYVNLVDKIKTSFDGWKLGNRLRITSAIVDEPNIGFEVSLENIEVGDCIAYTMGLTQGSTSDSHIMLVIGVSEDLPQNEVFDKLLVVSSVGISNTRDVRGNCGLGIGYVGMRKHEDNPKLCLIFTQLTHSKGKTGKIFRFTLFTDYQRLIYSTLTCRSYLGVINRRLNFRIYKVMFPRQYKESKEQVIPMFHKWWSFGENELKEEEERLIVDEQNFNFSMCGKKELYSKPLFLEKSSFSKLFNEMICKTLKNT